jgi:hypothetical protein
MNVFLSYALHPFDAPIAARLRAVAAAYEIAVLLPARSDGLQYRLTAEVENQIRASDAVIALITQNAPVQTINSVNNELRLAAQFNKPVIALIERGVKFQPGPETQVVSFNREEYAAHEQALVDALSNVRQKLQLKRGLVSLGWIAGITLGLVALSELVSEKK